MRAVNRRRRLKALALVIACLGSLAVSTPARASVSNPVLGALDVANPAANVYAGCVAATMVGNGFIYRTLSALQTALSRVWPTIPSPIAGACRTAVNSSQTQICLVPASGAPCTGVGVSANSQWTSYVSSFDAWDLYSDGQGCCGGYAQARLSQSDPSGTAQGSVTGTFSLPSYVCTSYLSCPAASPGLYSDCGPFSCGPVTWFNVSLTGRTPDIPGYPNGEPAWGGYVHAVDGYGHVVYDGSGVYGNWYWGGGCGGPEPHECGLVWSFRWNCLDAAGNPGANCANQALTVTFSPFNGYRDGSGDPPSPATLVQQVEITLSTDNLSWHPNAPICGYPTYYNFGAPNDCLRWNDPRLTYKGRDGAVGQVRDNRAGAPAAVIDLDSSSLRCLVGFDAFSPSATSCTDVTGGSAPVLQTPKAPPLRPLIFVPGIAGSELAATTTDQPTVTGSHGQSVTPSYKTNDIVWLNGAWLNPVSNENFDVLRFDSSGQPIVPDFQPAHRDTPELGSVVGVLGNGYAGVEDFFKSRGYTPGQNFFFAPYDWRYSADHAMPDLANAVAVALQRNPGADGVDVIAHSMGTLVTRHFLANSPLAAQVKHVVLLAGPHLGTPKGLVAAVYGVGVPESPPLGIQPDVERYIFQTLPGGLDQSVQQSYYTLYRGQDAQHPVPLIDLRGGQHAYSYPELRNFELKSNVTNAALTTAETFHGGDLGWGNQLAGQNIALFAGTGKCTIGQIQFRSAAIRGGVRSYTDYADVNGDGTVVEGVSSMNEGRLVPFPVYYRQADHAQMGQSSAVLSDALAWVHDKAITKGTPTLPGFFSFCRAISVHSPMELQITDGQEQRLGGLDASTQYNEIADTSFDRIADMKVATVATAGPYKITLAGTGSGESTIKVRDWGDGVANSTVLFPHLLTTPATRGSFAMDGNGVPGPLTLDVNGDGSDVRTISPVVLTGAAANDTTPPDIHITSPAGSQAFVGTAPLTWTASDSESGVALSQAVIDAGAANSQVLETPGPVTLTPGRHDVSVIAEDRAENAAQATTSVSVFRYQWLPPLTAGDKFHAGRSIPVRFSVLNLAAQPVDNQSAIVSVIDSHGRTVMGPYQRGSDPARGLVFQGDHYHADVPTDGLAPGNYRIRASFSSAELSGMFDWQVTIV